MRGGVHHCLAAVADLGGLLRGNGGELFRVHHRGRHHLDRHRHRHVQLGRFSGELAMYIMIFRFVPPPACLAWTGKSRLRFKCLPRNWVEISWVLLLYIVSPWALGPTPPALSSSAATRGDREQQPTRVQPFLCWDVRCIPGSGSLLYETVCAGAHRVSFRC